LLIVDSKCSRSGNQNNRNRQLFCLPLCFCGGFFLFTLTCFLQVIAVWSPKVARKPDVKRRSGCPVSLSLEVFGDRWSLLIIRDLMVRGFRTFKQFQQSGEGIATNILADRLEKLMQSGIISSEIDESDRRSLNYRLTEKGIDLAPVLLELLIWGARHAHGSPDCAPIQEMASNREQVLAEVRRRWQERDYTPLIPTFNATVIRNLGRKRRQHQ
jgi:DNA-binding HxlR family transcriptional regulator